MDVMPSAGPLPESRWYHRPVWVLVLLFLVLGPLALPYLWNSPSFSRRVKIALTVMVVAYTALFIDETIRLVRAVSSEMEALGTR